MGKKIKKRCVIISAGEIGFADLIKKYLNENDTYICADSGLENALTLGVSPNVLIGDFDSCPENKLLQQKCKILRYPPEKDETDTALAVRYGIENGFDDFLLIGMLGKRFDHTMANLALLLNMHQSGIKAEIFDGQNKIFFLNKKNEVYRNDYKYISFFAFGCSSATFSAENLKYPVDNYVLSADSCVAVSNEFLSKKSSITLENGNILAVLSQEM